MSAQRPGTIYKIDTITNSNVDSNTGTITYKLGTATDGSVYTQDAEAWSGLGIAALPALPTSQGGATSISLSRSDYNMVIGSRDIRYGSSLVSDIKNGEIYIYAVGANGNNSSVIKLKDGDSIVISNKGSITITSPTTTITNGGSPDYVAIASKVATIINTMVIKDSNNGNCKITPITADSIASGVLKADQ